MVSAAAKSISATTHTSADADSEGVALVGFSAASVESDSGGFSGIASEDLRRRRRFTAHTGPHHLMTVRMRH